jgi:putative addiction module killer protein
MAAIFEVRRTAEVSGWLDSLESPLVRAAILTRLIRLGLGNPGDVKAVGSGVSELRVDIGPGYRVYYLRIGAQAYLVVGGGDKSTQVQDIERAIAVASQLREVSRKKQPRKPK